MNANVAGAGFDAHFRAAAADGAFSLSRAEMRWLGRRSSEAEELPETEDTFIENALSRIDRKKVRLDQYGFEEAT